MLTNVEHCMRNVKRVLYCRQISFLIPETKTECMAASLIRDAATKITVSQNILGQ